MDNHENQQRKYRALLTAARTLIQNAQHGSGCAWVLAQDFDALELAASELTPKAQREVLK